MLGELTNDFFIWTSIKCPACNDSLLYIMGKLHICSECGHYGEKMKKETTPTAGLQVEDIKMTSEKIKNGIKVLVACEESQVVCIEFRKLGFEAYSCDILPCSGGHPEWHLQEDVTDLLKQNWDAVIAFPPCTHLAVSGSRHFAIKQADGRQQKGIDFFNLFTKLSHIDFVAIENPIGIMSSKYRKPNQIVHPYHFGDPERKATCLWLKGLPKLTHTNIVEPDLVIYKSKKSKSGFSTYSRITGCNPSTNGEHNAKLRSKTYPGIAKAMAEQWGSYLIEPIKLKS